jgi:hypothetical protein
VAVVKVVELVVRNPVVVVAQAERPLNGFQV